MKSCVLGRLGVLNQQWKIHLHLFCPWNGSTSPGQWENPAGIAPEPREIRAHPLPESSSPKTRKILHPNSSGCFGLGAVWCLVMDLPPRALSSFSGCSNAPLLMSCPLKTHSATPQPLRLLFPKPWTEGDAPSTALGCLGVLGRGCSSPAFGWHRGKRCLVLHMAHAEIYCDLKISQISFWNTFYYFSMYPRLVRTCQKHPLLIGY